MVFHSCAVPGCEDKNSPRHRFPNPEKDKDRFNMWIHLVNNPQLFDIMPSRIYNNFRVCHRHFSVEDKSTNVYLKRTATPSLKLPGQSEEIASMSATPSIQSSSLENLAAASNFVECQDERPVTPEILELSPHVEQVTPTRRCSPGLLRSVNAARSVDLTPKAKTLYRKARNYRKKLSIYKRRYSSFKKCLNFAENHFEIMNSGLRSEAVNFCIQQLFRKPAKKHGIRFNLQEKLMSLALYKTSGAGYRFLSKLFNLPSKRTLSRLLLRIPVETGINDFLMENLKLTVKHMKSSEKLCMLIFDEIALMPHVSYNKHSQEISGVNNGRICDHALVFMVRGVTRKWKQTVCYSFCKGSTKSYEIRQMLSSLIHCLKDAGLKVIATICDQGSPNQSAIEQMVKEAHQIFIEKGQVPKRRIIVDNDEIIPLYDVPHLIRNKE